MQFVNIRELSRSISKYLKLANENGEVIITRNGHPYAILQRIDDKGLEDYILAKHLGVEKDFGAARDAFRQGKTVNARDLLEKTNDK